MNYIGILTEYEQILIGNRKEFSQTPKSNKPDIKELDEEITDGLKITFVENMNEVLERALA